MKENLNLQTKETEKINESEAKEKFEEIFKSLKEQYPDIGIIDGAKYSDYLSAMQKLSFLKSDLEKLDLINYTALTAMESSVDFKKNSEYEIHRIFLDRSARILGVFLHDVLSKMNEEKHGLLNKEIFFVNPNNVLNGESEEKEKKVAEIILSGEKGKKIINIIVDEYISSGKGSRKVRDYFDKIYDKYKTDETTNVYNDVEGFYSSENFPSVNAYRITGIVPSWYSNKKISGLIEKERDNGEIIVPSTDKEIKKIVSETRESISGASLFVANIAKDGLLNPSFLENKSAHSTISFEEKRILSNKILEFLNCLLFSSSINSGLKILNDIEKMAENTKNKELFKKIPEIKITLDKMKELKEPLSKEYTDLVILIRDEVMNFI